ncbi:unnamed protein product, partial [marine sediment metagenome]
MTVDITKYPFFTESPKMGFAQFKAVSELTEESMNKFAVILRDRTNRLYHAFVEIPEDGNLAAPAAKLALHMGLFPQEMSAVAKGVLNTLFMAKEGSATPLFADTDSVRSNILDINDIDWEAFDVSQKQADRPGYTYNDTFLPLDTKANIKAAAEMFGEYANRFDGYNRVEFATKIAQHAKAAGIEVPEEVTKYAAGSLNPEFYDLMSVRIKAAE